MLVFTLNPVKWAGAREIPFNKEGYSWPTKSNRRQKEAFS